MKTKKIWTRGVGRHFPPEFRKAIQNAPIANFSRLGYFPVHSEGGFQGAFHSSTLEVPAVKLLVLNSLVVTLVVLLSPSMQAYL